MKFIWLITGHHDHGYYGYHGHRHRVAFTAVASSSTTYGSGTTIPFTTVKTNYGHAYNNGNYRFTAPSNGLYVFSWSIGTHSSYYAYTKLVKNGSTYHQSHCSSGFQLCGATVTIFLHKHDQVWLEADHSSTYVYATISYFSGWKLNWTMFVWWLNINKERLQNVVPFSFSFSYLLYLNALKNRYFFLRC